MPPKCPTCERFMEFIPDGPTGPVHRCPGCGRGVLARSEDAPQKPARKDLLERACEVREADLVQAIKAELEARGFIVQRTGQRMAKGAGNDVGIPDVFAAKKGHNLWRALEVKLPGGVVSRSQKVLVDAGVSTLVYSVEDALRAVAEG